MFIISSLISSMYQKARSVNNVKLLSTGDFLTTFGRLAVRVLKLPGLVVREGGK